MESATWVIPADAERIRDVRASVTDFATAHHVADPPIADIRLAVSEAVTNAVLHAFRDPERGGTITASVDIDDDAHVLTIRVCDDGSGMTPRPDSPGLGLGLPLIARVARHTNIGPGPNGLGTLVCMSFDYEASTLN
jgi:serine/threonine-protein kinase RsbW/stage II sporulation protein AB (anti-sigma F factor)